MQTLWALAVNAPDGQCELPLADDIYPPAVVEAAKAALADRCTLQAAVGADGQRRLRLSARARGGSEAIGQIAEALNLLLALAADHHGRTGRQA